MTGNATTSLPASFSESFASAMEVLGAAPRLAVAVSGGSDSIALALLTNAWARERGGKITALTVDHRLRPESSAEALQVSTWMAAEGIPHETLVWNGPKPTTNLQAAAREARYKLLTTWCQRNSVRHLALGHHRDDQAETFLLRLARGSGPSGLAAMGPATERNGIRLLRPLLGMSRAALQELVRRTGHPWLNDPTNYQRRFARVRARTATASLPDLAGAATIRARARAGIEALSDELLHKLATWRAAGFCLLDPNILAGAPPQIAAAAIARVLMVVGGRTLPPGQSALARLVERASRHKGGTLHGVRLALEANTLLVVREARNLPRLALPPGATGVWDGRFLVKNQSNRGVIVAALGDDGWSQVRAVAQRSLPVPVRGTLPAFWAEERPIAVPHLGVDTPTRMFSAIFRVTSGFNRFAVVSPPG